MSKSGLAIMGWIANLTLIPVVAFYFMRDGRDMLHRVRDLLPRPIEPVAVRLTSPAEPTQPIELTPASGTGVDLVRVELVPRWAERVVEAAYNA